MVRDEEKYQKALLFRQRGFSYSEIAKIVGVSRSTLSNWFAHKAFSKKIKIDNEVKARHENVKRISIVNKARQKEREKNYYSAIKSAVTEYGHYKSSPLFIAGVMLYVSNGDTKHISVIRLTDSNVDFHRIFLRFAEKFLGLSRKDVRFWLSIPQTVSEKEAKLVWSKALRLSIDQFSKTQLIHSPRQTSALHNGVGNTIIGDALLKRKLLKWIELTSKELTK